MKRKLLICVLATVLILLLAGCGCDHEWLAATCTAPKTCQLCNETEGEPLPHTWKDATCTSSKTCSVCNTTEGEPLPHTWKDATCTTPKTCSVCNVTEGEALSHTWQEATCTAPKTCTACQVTEGEVAAHTWQEATTEAPKTCSVCKKTEGSKLKTDSRFTTKDTKHLQGTWTCDVVLTDQMLGMEGFSDVKCKLSLKFGKTGELTTNIKLKDEKGFMANFRQYTIDLTYASFAQQGMSKDQANQAVQEAYGLSVEDYVDAMLKNIDIDDMFEAFHMEEVYYVKDGNLYTAISWKAKFEKCEYTLKDGVLTVEELTLEEGGEPLKWKKS